VKKSLTQAAILAFPIFEIGCDAFGVVTGGFLTQEGKPLAIFSEKLCDLRRKHSTYDKELYTIVRCLKH